MQIHTESPGESKNLVAMAAFLTNDIGISGGRTKASVVFEASQVILMCIQVSEPLLQVKNAEDYVSLPKYL